MSFLLKRCPPAQAPSVFYRAWLWRLGLVLVRVLPLFVLNPFCLVIAELYYRFNRQRREVVIGNLLPALKNDRAAAEQTARALFRQFALKLLALWRFESGVCLDTWFTAGTEWAILEKACARGKGVLLLTPHLGNWELGGALLARRGVKLVVLTQAEPSEAFTEMRKSARERWGIETLVIGGDGFAFVEIIKRLHAGENIALLIDRPPLAKAVMANLFGRVFPASIAAAELARATGCALIGVTLVRTENGYSAHILTDFEYDRRELGSREARCELTRRIVRAFEPEIQRHLDQWFHFVPIWPEEPGIGTTQEKTF